MQEQEIVYDPQYVYFQIDRRHTNYVNRILEGYEYVGVMTTVNKYPMNYIFQLNLMSPVGVLWKC